MYRRKPSLILALMLMFSIMMPHGAIHAQVCYDNGGYCAPDGGAFNCNSLCWLLIAAAAGAGAGYAAGHGHGKKGDDGDTGPQGPAGPQGLQGVAGPAGPAGASTSSSSSSSSSSSCCCHDDDDDLDDDDDGIVDLDRDEGQTLSFAITLDVGDTTLGANAVVTPFVALPDGTVRLGSNFTNFNTANTSQTQTIIVSDPFFGTYHAGVQYDNNDGVVASNLVIDVVVTASRDGSVTTIASGLEGPAVTTDVQLTEDFSYESTGSVP